jgi:hypothetical protein
MHFDPHPLTPPHKGEGSSPTQSLPGWFRQSMTTVHAIVPKSVFMDARNTCWHDKERQGALPAQSSTGWTRSSGRGVEMML